MATASPFADLELSLAPREGGGYSLSLRLTQHDGHVDDWWGPITVELDTAALLARAADLEAYGALLGSAILGSESSRAALEAARRAHLARGRPLRVRLLLPDELQPLSWELLTDPRSERPLAWQGGLLLSRYLSAERSEPVILRPRHELRALVVVAAPSDLEVYSLEGFDAEAHADAALAALGQVAVTILGAASGPRATWAQLSEQLRAGYDLLYLVAHGNYHAETNEPWLMLTDAGGRAQRLSAADLATLMGSLGADRPRLAVLASCASAGNGYGRATAALGPLLARAGVPAVVAMQGRISLESARLFARVFFDELLEDGLADHALAMARLAVYNHQRPDWWVPVLYTRLSGEGRIWAARPAPDPAADALELLGRMPVEGDRPLPAIANLPAHSRINYLANPQFVGRAQELRQLAQLLKGADPSALGLGTAVVITGLGGVGKTNLANEFVHRYGQYFAGGVFWLSFASADEVPKEVAACGGPGHLDLSPGAFAGLTLEHQIALVRAEWHRPIPRLLIFDNCESDELFETWRPKTGGCRVLVTSRRGTWPRKRAAQVLRLGVLTGAAGVALLRCYRPDWPASDASLRALAAELGNLPLALHLAGSFLEAHPRVTPRDYLDRLLRLSAMFALRPPGGGAGGAAQRSELSVELSFRMSFQQLDPNDQTDALARRLLARMAHFDLEAALSRDLLQDLAGPGQDDELQIDDACTRLADLGLLELQAKQQELALHRLVAQFGRTASDPAARVDVLNVLRARMGSEPSLALRRTRAFQLTRLRWLDEVAPVAPAELLEYAELIARYVASPATQAYLAEAITTALEPEPAPMSGREHARLRVIRAALRGQQGRLEEALADYQAAKQSVDDLFGEGASDHEDHHLQARINLGLGNIRSAQAQELPKGKAKLRRSWLAEATRYYHASIAAAKLYVKDPLLTVGALCELGYCAGLLRRWVEAEQKCREAQQLLDHELAHKRIDEQAHAHYYASVLEVKSLIFWERGQHSASAADYLRAYDYAVEEIEFLRPWEDRESEKLFTVHFNAGDCLIDLSNLAGQAAGERGLTPEELRAKVCRHWSIGLRLALRLGDAEKERDVRRRLEKYCPGVLLPDDGLPNTRGR